MAIQFTAVNPRGPRRIRLVFSEPIAAAAFTTLTLYAVACDDGSGATPTVTAGFVVPGCPDVVELALGADLVDGARYTVTVTSVPALGGGTASGSLPMVLGERPARPTQESVGEDAVDALYGVDLVWDGQDIVEAPSGDLATVSGRDNLQGAIERRVESNGLPWVAGYGANPRRYVDGSSELVSELRGDIVSQCLRDDRVMRATCTVLPPDEDHPEHSQLHTEVIPVDGVALPIETEVRSR